MIKVYSTEDCKACDKVKLFLDKNNVEYEAIDLTNDDKAVDEVFNKFGRLSVPITHGSGQTIFGYSESKLKEMIA